MQKLEGIAVSPGIAIGEALVIDREGGHIPRRFLPPSAADSELARLDGAMQSLAGEISRDRDAVARELGTRYGAIFDAHLQMLRDPILRGEMEQMLRERHFTAEYAVNRTFQRYAKVFQSLERSFIADRATDINDIEKRLVRQLSGQPRQDFASLTTPAVVIAHDLTPSETASMNKRIVLGFVIEVGGPGSHTAIVAQGLEIPAIVGAGKLLNEVSSGDIVILDGDHGTIIIRPDDATLADYRQRAETQRTFAVELDRLRDLPAQTADGQRITLLSNIEFPQEVAHCLDRGSEGIGLYRTEFLYLGATEEPNEDVHYQAYAEVLKAMPDKPVVIRTVDLGADKMAGVQQAEPERNPFLGLRSIRLSLRHLPTFRTQLRAILRASMLGDVRIMFPLISTVMELRTAKMVLADVCEDLEEHGIPCRRDVPVGIMVEVPSAAVMIDQLAPAVDFLSIGTNDLIQYTLAVDRTNKDVVALYNSCDPAVLRLIAQTCEGAKKCNKPISLCGQMSSNPIYTMLLIGMGLRSMSVSPSAVPEIKQACRAVTIPQCEAVAQRVATMDNARDIKQYLKEELRKVAPGLVH
jgi:phosphotransferase system enzyme I (PtsI)